MLCGQIGQVPPCCAWHWLKKRKPKSCPALFAQIGRNQMYVSHTWGNMIFHHIPSQAKKMGNWHGDLMLEVVAVAEMGWGVPWWYNSRHREFRVTDVAHSDLHGMPQYIVHQLLWMIFAVANHCAAHLFYEGLGQDCPTTTVVFDHLCFPFILESFPGGCCCFDGSFNLHLFVEFPFELLCSMLFSLSPRPCQFILLVCFRRCVLSCFLGLYIHASIL